MPDSKDHLKKAFRPVHFIWALLGLVATGMCFTGGGHPPPLIFLPLVVPVWILGHLFLWSARRLASGGFARVSEEGGAPQRWPWPLIPLALISGLATAALLFRLLTAIIPFGMGIGYPHLDVLILWFFHPVLFVGLLLRHRWSRYLAIVLILGWAGILARDALYLVVRGGHMSWLEWVTVLILELIAFFWLRYLLRSSRVKDFYAI